MGLAKVYKLGSLYASVWMLLGQLEGCRNAAFVPSKKHKSLRGFVTNESHSHDHACLDGPYLWDPNLEQLVGEAVDINHFVIR